MYDRATSARISSNIDSCHTSGTNMKRNEVVTGDDDVP